MLEQMQREGLAWPELEDAPPTAYHMNDFYLLNTGELRAENYLPSFFFNLSFFSSLSYPETEVESIGTIASAEERSKYGLKLDPARKGCHKDHLNDHAMIEYWNLYYLS